MTVRFDGKNEKRFREILEEFPEGTSRVIPAMNLAQEVFGAITPEVEEYLAERLDVPRAQIVEDLTFYNLYHREPYGRHILAVCNDISCNMLGSENLLEHLKHRLGVEPGEVTPDGKFTIVVAACLGGCEKAPAILVDGRQYGPLTPEEADRLLDRLAKEGTGEGETGEEGEGRPGTEATGG
jgi:NADH-quinone oxidoreductase subunit E